jgi:taurine---2-oxoglutarate transaminase
MAALGMTSLLTGRHALPRLSLVSASGPWLIDASGNRYFDASSGSICVNVGHGHPLVVQRLTEQASRLSFSNPAMTVPEELETLAACLVRATNRPGYKVAFAVGGTGAIELAIQLSRQYQRAKGRQNVTKVLTASLSYHGSSAFALALSGHRRRRPHVSDSFGITPSFHSPFGRRIGLEHDCTATCADDVKNTLEREPAAAVLIEPVNGATGGAMAVPDGYLARLRAHAAATDTVLIFDEVLTGLGRCGAPLATDIYPGSDPDIIVISKGLAAGYAAISAVIVAPRIASVLKDSKEPFPLTGTMAGSPMAASAALAVQDVLEESGVFQRTDLGGSGLRQRLEQLYGLSDIVKDFRGMGWFYGVELDKGYQRRVLTAARDEGLILYPFNGYKQDGGGEGIVVAPPLNTSVEDIEWITDRLSRSLAAAQRKPGEKD